MVEKSISPFLFLSLANQKVDGKSPSCGACACDQSIHPMASPDSPAAGGGERVSKHRLREPSRADFLKDSPRIFPGQPCAMRVRVPSGTPGVRGGTSAPLQATFGELRDSAIAVVD